MLDRYLNAAIQQAEIGLGEGGIPIGSVLVIDGEIKGRGYNKRLQLRNPILHAEMDCLANAGRLRFDQYSRATLYTTLSPCDMCAGAVLLYKIPKVVIGENRTFRGPESYLESRGVVLDVANSSHCFRLMQEFIEQNPSLWSEDIGMPINGKGLA